MTISTSTLRPGLLVTLKTTVQGNVRYSREDLEPDHTTKEGTREHLWQTKRVISDPQEVEQAWKLRSVIRGLICKPCISSAFGLLCPEGKTEELATAVAEARSLADKFNMKAKITRVGVYVLTGRIAQDDVEAVRSINNEVRSLLTEMQQGIKNLEPKAIREAAGKAKNIGKMLTPEAQARIQEAVTYARDAASKIVKAGETAAKEVDKVALKKVVEARTAFLDLDARQKVAAPKSKGRTVDLDPTKKATPKKEVKKTAVEIPPEKPSETEEAVRAAGRV